MFNTHKLYPGQHKLKALMRRRGTSMVETAIILTLLFLLTFGTLEIGIAVFRYHILANTSREIARQVVVHGSLADRLGTWGPTSISGTAGSTASGDESEIAEVARNYLVGIDPDDVTLEVEWIDIDDDSNPSNTPIESRVRVTLSTPHQPIINFFGLGVPPLQATTTMEIAH